MFQQIETDLSGKLFLPDGCHRLKMGVELREDSERHLRKGGIKIQPDED